jgi:hypothetical protein
VPVVLQNKTWPWRRQKLPWFKPVKTQRQQSKSQEKAMKNGLNDVLALKAELLENIQGDNPTDWRKKYSDFSSQLVAVRQDFVVNYGDLRETYGSECTNASRRAEFNDAYVIPFNKRLVVLANKLHS